MNPGDIVRNNKSQQEGEVLRVSENGAWVEIGGKEQVWFILGCVVTQRNLLPYLQVGSKVSSPIFGDGVVRSLVKTLDTPLDVEFVECGSVCYNKYGQRMPHYGVELALGHEAWEVPGIPADWVMPNVLTFAKLNKMEVFSTEANYGTILIKLNDTEAVSLGGFFVTVGASEIVKREVITFNQGQWYDSDKNPY